MSDRRKWEQIKSSAYFDTLPLSNYFINITRRKRFSSLYFPEVLYLEVTNHCNAACLMCPHDKMKRKRGHMSWEIFTRIVEECSAFEGKGLTFFLHKDGEPLLDPMLFKRIAYIKGRLTRSRVHFSTNAQLLNDRNIEGVLNSGLDSITLSLDGISRETYEEIRRGLKYEVTRSNIERFFAAKEAAGSRLRVTMQMVVGMSNVHEVSAFKSMWRGRADRVFVKSMHNFLDQSTSLHGSCLASEQLDRCKMPFREMFFYWNGDVGLCCWDYDQIAQLGNIREKHLLELYNSPAMNRIRSAMRRKRCADISPCNRCSQIYGKDRPMWDEFGDD